MKKSTEKKLKARGWRVGSAADFLGLSPEEAAFVEIKVSLATKLRKERQEKHLTQSALAALVASSQSRVAKMEAGDPSVSLDLLVKSLLAIGVSRQEVAAALSSRR
jgi:DNA-binding XRE family transcriptional regulator